MSNNSRWRTDRYSRAPSLSTIDSNEEANFSSHHHAQQTAQGDSPISPFYPNDSNYHSTASSLHSHTEYNQIGSKREPIYSSRELHNPNNGDPEHQKQTLDDFDLPRPPLAIFQPTEDDMPPRRAGTSSSISSAESGSDGMIKTKTKYMRMLLQLDRIPWWHNTLAAVSAWLVLAAFLVLPGTFTSIQKDGAFSGNASTGAENGVNNFIKNGIRHVPLLVLSGAFAGFGALTAIILYMLHFNNYVWLSWKIFQPMTLNALAGVLSTIVNVYTQQDSQWSPSAKLNAIVAGGVAGIAGTLFALYNFWLLERVKEDHRRFDPTKESRYGRSLPGYKY